MILGEAIKRCGKDGQWIQKTVYSPCLQKEVTILILALAKFSQDVASIRPQSKWCHDYRQFVSNRLIDAPKYTS